MRIIVSVCVVAILSGCATAYQRAGASGGFSDIQLSENVWRVSFTANGRAETQRAEDFAWLRSAELTLEKGYTHFAIMDTKSTSNTSAFTTPMTSYTTGSVYGAGSYAYGNAITQTYGGQTFFISRPTTTITVVMYKGKPEIQGFVYEAKFICNSFGQKYKVTCGEKK